nr:hypothetical protein [Tanacetum cinerariifolium]
MLGAIKKLLLRPQQDNPHQTLKGKGIVDSGCSWHMTKNKTYLVEYQDFIGGPVSFRCSKGQITSKDTECLVLSPDFKLPDKNQVLLRVPRQNNMYSFNLENIVPSRDLVCLIAKTKVDESKKWHRRMTTPVLLIIKESNTRPPPVTAENKANKTVGPKEANNSAEKNGYEKLNGDIGSKINEEPVDQEDQAFLEEIERLKKQEKKADDAAKTLRKTFAKSTKDMLLQEGAARASSTNNVNIASTPVNTARTRVNTASTPVNTASTPVITASLSRNIPRLEDIYEVPSDGIFTSASYDVEGVVADFTILESTVNGHRQVEGIDYDEVFALMAKIEAIRIFLAFASYMGFIVYQTDVKSAFLYGKIDEEVCVSQPPGFIDPKFPKKVYKFVKLCMVYTKLLELAHVVFVIIKSINPTSVKTASTPIKTQKPLVKDAKAADVDVHLYRSMIDSLMYLSASRPDIMYAVCACSRFQVTSKTSHLHAVKRIFKKSTTGGCQFLGRRLISWQCKRQTIVANSTTEAECEEDERRYTLTKETLERMMALRLIVKFETSTEAPQMVSSMKLPILKKGEYILWTIKMEQYLAHTNYALWEVILNGHSSQAQGSSSYADELMFLFFANQSSTSQLDKEDLEQINQDDLEEIHLKWQVAMLFMRVKRFYKKTRRKLEFNGKEPVGFDKNKVECFNCHRRGHFARDCRSTRNSRNTSRDDGKAGYRGRDNGKRPAKEEDEQALVFQDGLGTYDMSYQVEEEVTNLALMAFTSNPSSSNYELGEALKEKEDLKAKLEKSKTFSKNLTKLFDSQISAKVKNGLGYDSQFNEKEVLDIKEEDVTETLFDNHSSDEENSVANDRFKKGDGYHVVPPPLTGNYMPPKPDLSFAGLDDFIYKFKISETVTSFTKDEKDALETSTTFVKKPKEDRSSALLIKDWETDIDDDSVLTPEPIPAKIAVTPVKTTEQTKNLRILVQVLNLSHLIKDCTFHKDRMAKKPVLPTNVRKGTGHTKSRPVWNNVQTINHQNKFAPTAVFTRSGRIPVSAAKPKAAASTSAAKPVNTAGPKQSVNFLRTRKKTKENAEFHQIVDFLFTCSINYALTVRPTIYSSYIEQVWNTAISKTVNSIKQIHAIVDGKALVISKSSVRSDLLFNDEDDIEADEAIHQDGGYSVERAIATDASLVAAHDSDNIAKTQSMVMYIDPISQEIGSGDRPGRQETTLGMEQKTDLMDLVPPTPHDSPLSRGMKLFKISTSNKTEELNLSDKGSGETKVFDYTTAAKKNVNAAKLVSTPVDAVNAASVILVINVAGPFTSIAEDIFKDEMTTMSDTLMDIRRTRPRTTLVVIHDVEEEPRRATPTPTEDDAEKEELKACLDIVSVDDIATDVEILATKYPIVNWKTHTLIEHMMYYQIIKASGSSKNYKILTKMCDDFDKQDIMDLYRLVKERHETASPEGYDLLLWGDLITLFEPSEKDVIWKAQQDYNLISWRLFDSCGVHVLLMDTGIAIHMLVERKYPLIQELLSRMLNRRLEINHESEMAFELIRFIKT